MIQDPPGLGYRGWKLLDEKKVSYSNRANTMTLKCPDNSLLDTLAIVFNLSMDTGSNLQYRPNGNSANMKSYIHEQGEWGWGQNRHIGIVHNGTVLVGMLGGDNIRRNEAAGTAVIYPPHFGTYYGRRKVVCDYSVGDTEGEVNARSSIIWTNITTAITSITLARTGNFWGEVELYRVE